MAANICEVTENIKMVTHQIKGMEIGLHLITIDDVTAMKYRVSLRGSSATVTLICKSTTDIELFTELTKLVEEILESAGQDGVGNSPIHPRAAGKGSSWPPPWATRFLPLPIILLMAITTLLALFYLYKEII